MKEKLAERIRMARLMKNLSQQNMADELGLTVASYSNIERGVTEITVSRLFEIAKILQLKVSSMLDFDSSYSEKIKEPSGEYFTDTNHQLKVIIEKLNKQQDEIEKLNSELNLLKNKRKD
ncbi:MAG: helix-turn-helix transcriptional regulator [Flavobacteriia bacterium]|nr:helix-turn-helix transcriptional regulator [Flavobacteriia bacterium]